MFSASSVSQVRSLVIVISGLPLRYSVKNTGEGKCFSFYQFVLIGDSVPNHGNSIGIMPVYVVYDRLCFGIIISIGIGKISVIVAD